MDIPDYINEEAYERVTEESGAIDAAANAKHREDVEYYTRLVYSGPRDAKAEYAESWLRRFA